MTWSTILEQWRLIEPDLHQHYGIDVSEPGLLRARTYRWLQSRIIGLLSVDSRLYRHFKPPEQTPGANRRSH